MRVMYTGMDGRVRIAEASRIKFLDDGFQPGDKPDEKIDGVNGPVIIAHIPRARGGKRLILKVPTQLDMADMQALILQNGYFNLDACEMVAESLY